MSSLRHPFIEVVSQPSMSSYAEARDRSFDGRTSRPRLQDLRLFFFVSSDEEFVRLEASCAGKVHDLGSRNHNYLLLTLARQRLADDAAGFPAAACGWIHLADLAHDPSMSGPRLNVDVFRIRQQFTKLGLPDAANVIERRQRVNQLRIGTDLVDIIRA